MFHVKHAKCRYKSSPYRGVTILREIQEQEFRLRPKVLNQRNRGSYVSHETVPYRYLTIYSHPSNADYSYASASGRSEDGVPY